LDDEAAEEDVSVDKGKEDDVNLEEAEEENPDRMLCDRHICPLETTGFAVIARYAVENCCASSSSGPCISCMSANV
jgi:hypothetical protein